MRVLGIETSCDETAAAVLEDGRILSNVVSSQIALHREFHGVVPELAARAHLQKIYPVLIAARRQAGGRKIHAVAYTRGPGLLGPLLIGKVAAQAISIMEGIPLVPVNHLEGHIFAAEFEHQLEFPLVALIVSGGHTELILCRGYGRYKVLGRTRDDAAGEAYDKVARLLGLDYPGGPVVDRAARQGNPAAVSLPRPYMPDTWDFSFAGLKTAVLYYLRSRGAAGPDSKKLSARDIADVCAAFQEAVADTLSTKLLAAAKKFRVKSVVIGGGVAANSRLRELCLMRSQEGGFRVAMPSPRLCTDNGAMIARVAWHRLRAGALGTRYRSDPGLRVSSWT